MRRFLFAMTTKKPRQFAPLRVDAALSEQESQLPALKGIVFDVDGTLCKPQNYMFADMRSVLGITKTVDILDHIYGLPTPEAQQEAMEAIRAIERREMVKQAAQPGLAELMSYLDSRGIPKGICTRNFEQPVSHLLTKFLAGSLFEPVITRDFRPPKPDPAGILHIAGSWGLRRAPSPEHHHRHNHQKAGQQEAAVEGSAVHVGDASGLIMVGDSVDDMAAGRRAGAATVLLVNDVNAHLAEHDDTDLAISRLDELIGILEDGFRGRESGGEALV